MPTYATKGVNKMKKTILILFLIYIVYIIGTEAVIQDIFVNMTLDIDVYTDNEENIVRTAELRYPDKSLPTGPFSVSDACNSPFSKSFPIQFFMKADFECNMSYIKWDIGSDIRQIKNNTDYVLHYYETDIQECAETVLVNIDCSKELEICRGKTEILDTYSTLQSAYDVCDNERDTCFKERKTCKEDNESLSEKNINYFIGGIVVAVAIMFAMKPKLYKSPVEKQFVR